MNAPPLPRVFLLLLPFAIIIASCVAADERLYRCATTEPRCPDGLVCLEDALCHPFEPTDSGVDAGESTDSGSDPGLPDASVLDAGSADAGVDAGTCVALGALGCLENDDCCDVVSCVAGRCVVAGPNCANVIDARGGFIDSGFVRRYSTTGSTDGGTVDANDSCGGAGRGVGYRFTADGFINVSATMADGGAAPMLAIASDCTLPAFACKPGGVGTSFTELRSAAQPPGEYVVIVESPDGSVGNYTLDIEVSRTLRSAEICANASGSASAGTVSNDFGRFIREPEPENPCDAGYHDVVYSFGVFRDGGVRVTISPDAGVELMFGVTRGTACRGSTSVSGCIDAAGWGLTESVTFGATPGTYYLFVSTAADGGSGTFRGTVQLP